MAICKRQTKCGECGGYIFKGDTFCHTCQNAYVPNKNKIVKPEQSTQPPKGFRLLRIGELVKKADLYYIGDKRWIPINSAWIGMKVTTKCRPGARKQRSKQ